MNNSNTNNFKIVDTLLNVFPVFLAFLMPVFFLPITLEFFEFNKLSLLTVTTLFMMVVWMVKMIIERKVLVTKSKMDLPVLLLLALFILSSIFSVNRVTSIFGSQGRWFPSLFGMIALVAFYYVASSNISSKKTAVNVLYGFVAGTTVSSVIALLSYFDIALGASAYLQSAGFTTTGSIITTVVIAAIAAALSLGLIATESKPQLKGVFALTALVNVVAVLTLNQLAGYVILAVGILGVAYSFASKVKAKENIFFYGLSVGASILFAAVMLLPQTRGVLVNPNYPRELRAPALESWRISTSAIRDFPVLGTGPSTFYLNYPRYRSVAQNYNDTWGVRFDKPYNEVFNILGTLGLVGLAVMLFFGFRVVGLGLRNTDNSGTVKLTSIALLATMAAFAVTYSTVLLGFMMFLFMASLVAQLNFADSNKAEKVSLSLAAISERMSLGFGERANRKETLQYIIAIPLTALVIAGSLYTFRAYAAEYYMRKAVLASADNDANGIYTNQTRAIQLMPQKDAYRNAFARTNIGIANALAGQEDLTDQDRVTIQNLLSQAISNSRLATEVLNPLNPAGWETRAFVYRALRNVAEDAPQWELRSYNTAMQLDPTNPNLRIAAGGVHYAAEDYLTAANYFKQAADLKNDYANAHYNLAYALFQLQSFDNAKRELLIVQSLIERDSEDYKKIAEDIARVDEELAKVAGTADQRPSVAQLEGTEEQPTAQAPLTQPGTVEEEAVIEEGAVNENVNLNPQPRPEQNNQTEPTQNEEDQTNNETDGQAPVGGP